MALINAGRERVLIPRGLYARLSVIVGTIETRETDLL
jgi:hypothetical protein